MNKFKHLIVLLPLIILWASFYIVKDVDLINTWYVFPYSITAIVAIAFSIGIVLKHYNI